jgi:hypothetical protein
MVFGVIGYFCLLPVDSNPTGCHRHKANRVPRFQIRDSPVEKNCAGQILRESEVFDPTEGSQRVLARRMLIPNRSCLFQKPAQQGQSSNRQPTQNYAKLLQNHWRPGRCLRPCGRQR